MAKKTAAKTDKTDITSWLGRLKRAERVRDEADREFGYTRASQQYQGDYKSAMPTFISGVEIVPINEVYAYTKAFVPSVYSRDPYICANPVSANKVKLAKIAELFLNAKWRQLHLKREIKRTIIDALLSEGWVKVGYSAVFGSIEPKAGEPPLEANEFVEDEEIFAARVSWKNMLRDPDAINGIHDARWVAERIIRPLDAVKASKIYSNTADIQPVFILDPEDRKNQMVGGIVGQYDPIAYAVLWEIWDRDSNRVFTISEGADGFLMDKPWPYKMCGYPYALLRFNENPDECYAPNCIGPWEPQLWEKMKIRAMQLDHIKRFNRQMSVEEGAMSRAELDKMTSGKTGAIIKRKKGFEPPRAIEYPQVQSDMYGVEQRIDLDKDNVSGQPNAVRSAPQRTQSRTLGEIDRLISAFQSRQSEPQDVIEDFCEEIAYKIYKLSQEFMSGEDYVRATNKDIGDITDAFMDPTTGKSKFDGHGFTVTKEDLEQVEVDLDVRSGSTLPLDKERRIETLSTLLKLGPTLGIAPNGLVARTLGKSLISELEMKEVEQAFDEEMKQIDAQKIIASQQQQDLADMSKLKIANMKAAGPQGMMARGVINQRQPTAGPGGTGAPVGSGSPDGGGQ